MNKITWKQKKTPFTSFEEQETFIFKDFKGALTDSTKYRIKNMDIAISFILKFKNKPIKIVGDYDVDGMTSTSEAMTLFSSMSLSNVEYYLPKRFSDGYGLSDSIIDNFLTGEPGLLITIDNGIAALEAIKKAKTKGWTVLILDHHLATVVNGKTALPEVDLIIDPNAIPGSATFYDYCAAGLVYKLAQEADRQNLIPADKRDGVMAKITSLAAIGTVCDCVKLVEQHENSIYYDNYLIIKNGLVSLMQNEGRTTGLYCLLRALNKDININEVDLGFTVGPVLNALSRMEDAGATKVMSLLLRDDNNFNECDKMALELISANDERKHLTSLAIPILEERIYSNNMEHDYPIVVAAKDAKEIHPGLVGLIAGQLCEEFNTAVVVLTPDGYFDDLSKEENILHGSARAPSGTNIKVILDNSSEFLLQYGGHAHAAGVKLKTKNLEEFRAKANAVAGEKPAGLFCREYNFEIGTKDIEANLDLLSKYAPFGFGHTAPIFKINNFICKKNYGAFFKILGAEGKTIKLFGHYADAICFNGAKPYADAGSPLRLNLYGTLSVNMWNGNSTNQVIFSDFE